MFFLGHFDMKAGGALGALVVGLIASNAWEKGFPRFASLGPSFEYSPYSEWRPMGGRARCVPWGAAAYEGCSLTIAMQLPAACARSGTCWWVVAPACSHPHVAPSAAINCAQCRCWRHETTPRRPTHPCMCAHSTSRAPTCPQWPATPPATPTRLQSSAG